MSFKNELKTILWKNYIIRKKSWFLTLLEICVPCLGFILVLYLYLKGHIGNKPTQIPEKVFEPFEVQNCFSTIYESYSVLFAPNTSETEKIMNNVRKRIFTEKVANVSEHFQQPYLRTYLGVASEYELENWFRHNFNKTNFRSDYGIVFESYDDKEFKYKIRIPSEDFDLDSVFKPPVQYLSDFDIYLQSCFITLQKTLDLAFMETHGKNISNVSLSMQAFPYPSFKKPADLSNYFTILLPYLVIGGFIFIIFDNIKKIVCEKESGSKELMKLMGIKPWMVWVGWLLNTLMIGVIDVTIITIVLKIQLKSDYHSLLEHSNPLILWIMLMLFLTSITLFIFIICALLSKPLIAVLIALVVYIVPVTLISTTMYDIRNFYLRLLLTIIFPTFNWFCTSDLINKFEIEGEGAGFSNLFDKPPGPNYFLSMAWLFLCYFLSIGLFSFFIWYFDNTMPGPYGRARPFYFIFEFIYKRKPDVLADDSEINEKNFEKPSVGTEVGLSVRNLTKVFPNGVYAVNGVNIDIYKGQITALLGHNGAGKTTTMSILTGMYSPTSGSVYEHPENGVNYNVFDDIGRFRNHLGLCPQHNLFIPYFTVIEHLIFFGLLKGLSKTQALADGEKLLRMLNILDKKRKETQELSGGMKRKLALAIALIGDPKVLILDEPTSGLDPESRRELWNVLLEIRQSRTIIITTHFMEEADVLGDQIAIMDHGRVVCYGSPIFLKKLYGTGYNLTLLTTPESNQNKITELIKRIVVDAGLKTSHKGQLTYSLPSDGSVQFSELFSQLENRKTELGITSIGISLTTMEEVFLRAGLDSDTIKKESKERNGVNEEEQKLNNSEEENGSTTTSADQQENMKFRRTSSTEYLTAKKVRGINLLIQQFSVIFKKKVLYTCRKPLVSIVYILVAVAMFFFAMRFLRPADHMYEGTALPLDFNLYKDTNVIINYASDKKSYADISKGLFENDVTVKENIDIVKVLLNEGAKDIENYQYKYAVALNWNANPGIAMYSSSAVHSSPISVNKLMNTISKHTGLNAKISVINHPLPVETSSGDDLCGVYFSIQAASMWLLLVPFGLLFVIGNMILFPLEERTNNAKQLQLMTGLSPVIYWTALFVWDLLIYALTILLALIPILFMDSYNIVTSGHPLGVLLLILTLYGCSSILYAYFFSFLLKSTGGTSQFILLNFILGMVLAVIIGILSALKTLLGEDIGGIIVTAVYFLALLNPHFALTYGLLNFILISVQNKACENCKPPSIPCIDNKPYFKFEENYIGREVLFLAIDIFFYIFILSLIECRLWAKFREFISNNTYSKTMDIGTMDDDVREERDKVDAGRVNQGSSSPVLIVDGLAKRFGSFQAVRGISFQVVSGECFGLLGVNGAGKTTTFRMLTGDELLTAGNAIITKYNLLNNRKEFLSQIGYCPQFDGINSIMTGRETLEMMGKLRGLTPESARKQANYWIDFLGLTEHANRYCGNYSGGNKRKLSTAMALIADPVIVFLDEPTSGVDPVARRKLWDVLTRCQKSGQSIILTSHSMDECEALCDRLTIMVRGEMKCIGNIEYLKQRFGQGFTLIVKISSSYQGRGDDMKDTLKNEIESKFPPQCLLKGEHAGLLHYHITNTSFTWSYIFKTMEDMMKKFEIIEDYTVSETTLEQVFISFAKQDR